MTRAAARRAPRARATARTPAPRYRGAASARRNRRNSVTEDLVARRAGCGAFPVVEIATVKETWSPDCAVNEDGIAGSRRRRRAPRSARSSGRSCRARQATVWTLTRYPEPAARTRGIGNASIVGWKAHSERPGWARRRSSTTRCRFLRNPNRVVVERRRADRLISGKR